MVFHCLFFSKLQWDIEGSAIMPLFLMLSGFTLAVVYGRHKYKRVDLKFIEFEDEEDTGSSISNAMFEPVSTSDPESSEPAGKVELRSLQVANFFQNRAARILPVYYLTTLLTIPYTLAGFGVVAAKDTFLPGNVITNVIPINTLFSFLVGSPYLGTAWTVATLCVFWFFFPYLLTTYQRYSDEDLVKKIRHMYYLQIVLLLGGVAVGLMATGNFWIAFGTGTMNPISRMPLFIMGICAGLLCGRHPSRGTVAGGSSVAAVQDTLPWPRALLSTFPSSSSLTRDGRGGLNGLDALLGDPESDWAAITFNISLYLLISFLVWSAVSSFVVQLYGAILLQAIVPFSQLTVIVGLTRDSSESNVAYSFLVHPLTQWLGKVSMTIYLVHYLFISYLLWYVHGWKDLPYCDMMVKNFDCDEQASAMLMPTWGIPVVIGLSMVASPIIFYCFEEPMRKLLQVQKK
jgi:peptidoglycan/LPS O-acetylase OafA/YrhL